MINARTLLRWIRRAMLGAVTLLLALSLVTLIGVRRGGFGLPHTSTSIGSVNGVFFYGWLRPASPLVEPQMWSMEFRPLWSQDYPYAGIFEWDTLGFEFTSAHRFHSQLRLAFSMTDIRVPYWPFLLILALPEIRPSIRRARARVIKNMPPAQTQRVESSTIAGDLPCVHCGYNLQTLSTTSLCPECGNAIVDTLTLSAELAQSRPGWLKCLALGNVLLLLTRVLLIAVYVQLGPSSYGRYVYVGAGICAIAATAFYLIGTYLLTLNEHPFLRSPDHRNAMRQRIIAVGILLFTGAAIYNQTFAASSGPWEIVLLSPWLMWSGMGFWHYPFLVMILLAWLLYCFGTILEYRYLGKLAGRLLDRFMIEHCTIAGIGAGLTNLLALWIVRDFVTGTYLRADLPYFIVIVSIIILWILFQIWTGFMNVYCASRFIQQAWLAEEHWRTRQIDAQTVQR